MATQAEWEAAYDEARMQANKKGRWQYTYEGEALVLESWLDANPDERPQQLPDGYDVDYFMDGYIADLDLAAGFTLWYAKGWQGLCVDADGNLPHCHTWFYWARFGEDEGQMTEHFVKQCRDLDRPLPQWYLDEMDED